MNLIIVYVDFFQSLISYRHVFLDYTIMLQHARKSRRKKRKNEKQLQNERLLTVHVALSE